jgi:hypothetical protein
MAPQNLGDDIGEKSAGRKPPADDKTDRDGGIEMGAGDMADGKGHGQHDDAEGQGDADEADTQARECRGQHGAAASPEDQPESTDEFSRQALAHGHGDPLFLSNALQPHDLNRP